MQPLRLAPEAYRRAPGSLLLSGHSDPLSCRRAEAMPWGERQSWHTHTPRYSSVVFLALSPARDFKSTSSYCHSNQFVLSKVFNCTEPPDIHLEAAFCPWLIDFISSLSNNFCFAFSEQKFIPMELKSSSGETTERNFSFVKRPAQDLIFLYYNYFCFVRKNS